MFSRPNKGLADCKFLEKKQSVNTEAGDRAHYTGEGVVIRRLCSGNLWHALTILYLQQIIRSCLKLIQGLNECLNDNRRIKADFFTQIAYFYKRSP